MGSSQHVKLTRKIQKPQSELPSGPPQSEHPRLAKGTQVSKVVPGVKVRPTLPPNPRPRTLLTMTPEALKLFALRYYLLGFGDTGRGFNADTVAPDNKAIRSILGVRFDRLYRTRESSGDD